MREGDECETSVSEARAMPRDPLPDSTLALLRDPYRRIRRRAGQLGAPAFRTRLMLRPAICLTGREAAALFYDAARFERAGAVPARISDTLFGEGGVQGLDGEGHRHRKAQHLALARPAPAIDRLEALFRDSLGAHAADWEREGEIALVDAMHVVLTEAVCRWAGIPAAREDLPGRARMLAAIFEGAGAIGPAFWQARRARRESDRWATGLIRAVRAGRLDAPVEGALAAVAGWRDGEGRLLPPEVAAVELLSILRPTVAIGTYIAFAAHAMHVHRQKPEGADELARFVREVRRLSPFFPLLGARTRQSFRWQGWPFDRGTRVILDLFGTNRDPLVWEDPDAFRPDRHRDREPGPFDLVPQGGGDHVAGHRCAGEWITIRLMRAGIGFLASRLDYRVPEQSLALDWRRIPALPRDRMRLTMLRAGR